MYKSDTAAQGAEILPKPSTCRAAQLRESYGGTRPCGAVTLVGLPKFPRGENFDLLNWPVHWMISEYAKIMPSTACAASACYHVDFAP